MTDFKVVDVELAAGANTVTLRATDLAGNVATKVLSVSLSSLKHLRSDDGPALTRSLQELQARLAQSLQDKVQKQIDYFENNACRMEIPGNPRSEKSGEERRCHSCANPKGQ